MPQLANDITPENIASLWGLNAALIRSGVVAPPDARRIENRIRDRTRAWHG
jgi:hypothetical protein